VQLRHQGKNLKGHKNRCYYTVPHFGVSRYVITSKPRHRQNQPFENEIN
jgi:hypothetical protein